MAGKVLVTGGSGFIAGELIRPLLDRGRTVKTTMRDYRKADAFRKAPTRPMPDGLVSILALFNAEVRGVKTEIGKVRHVDASHAKQRLGWTMRPVEDTIADCGNSLIEHGVVKV